MNLNDYRTLQSWGNKFKEKNSLDKYSMKIVDEFVEHLGLNFEPSGYGYGRRAQ